MVFNSKEFWESQSYTAPSNYSVMYERLLESVLQNNIHLNIVNPTQKKKKDLTYFDVLINTKIDSQDRVISKQEKIEEDLDNLHNGILNENLSDEVNTIMDQVNNEAKIKFLQMYFDSYMSPILSDATWRLGPVTGTVLETDYTDKQLGIIENGEIYTRSNFTLPYYRQYWGECKISDKEERYTSMFFPPYKIGNESQPGSPSFYMSKILEKNPEPTFDQDKFRLKREGFTYREAGFKAINDNIHFLQWLAEGCTGIVSTYLTEWDLSVYMQEKLMTPMPNMGPFKLFLNYRVRDDNPLSHESVYSTDRALVFNVAGSAVSKIDFDCQKLWRPSDYPLSKWWTSYKEGRDYKINKFEYQKDSYIFDYKYMSIYDDIKSDFAYETKTVKEIMRQQDMIGIILGTWPSMNMKYHHAFYYTDMDSLTDFEIKTQGWLKKVSGAEPGESAKKKKTLNNFIKEAKKEMLLNGGYYGSPTPPGLDGGYMSRSVLEQGLEEDRNEFTKELQDELEQHQSGQFADQLLKSEMNMKADASTMAKFTGINRFSPALFGGPHGADFNPNTIQAYFDDTNLFLRNVPRVSPNNANYFTSANNNDYFTDVNKFYADKDLNGCSPSSAIKKLIGGLTISNLNYAYARNLKTAWIEGTIEYNPSTKLFNKYNMPARSPQGEVYNYFGEKKFSSRTYVRTTNPWTSHNWWYNYTSYYNTYNVSWFTRRGFTYTYYTVTYYVQQLASFYYTGLAPYKEYDQNAMPNTQWKIIQHSFEKYSAPADSFWSWVNIIKGKAYLKEKYPDKMSTSTVFMLKFNNDSDEEDFKGRMMGGKSSKDFFFFQGNSSGGKPKSLFKATVIKDSYRNLIETKTVVNMIFFKFTRITYSYFNTEYLRVDLLNSGGTAGIFEDNLDSAKEPYSNRFETGFEYPMHLKTIQKENSNIQSNIIQKFTTFTSQEGGKDQTFASKTTQKTEVSGWIALIGFLTGSLLLMIAAIILMLKTQKKGTSGVALWVSSSNKGISGKGIIQNIQGINPPNTDPPGVSSAAGLKLPASSADTPIKALPFKFGNQSASSELQQSLAQIYTRASFVLDANTKEEEILPGSIISIDTPIRNFLSICMTQISYFKLTKEILIDNIDFDILHQALLNCVDKCVIKANGLTNNDEKISSEQEHILYNYWMEQAILLFGDKSTFNSTKEQLKSEFNRKITKFEYVIETLMPICQKHILDWTYNEIKLCYDLIWSMKEEADFGLIERYFFSYLNILYNYRFYFVAKRFNKENGTMWIMRALESVLEFVAPFADEMPPPPISRLNKPVPSYKVIFYELTNNTTAKRNAITDTLILDEDRISVVYVKVMWAKQSDFDKWNTYQEDPNNNREVPEVVEILHNGIIKYAFKPVNGMYNFISAEWLENEKNKKWNSVHLQDPQRRILDIDTVQWFITWGDAPDLTPIKWDVFGSININNLLEYSKASVPPEDLVCLIEEGSHFWTVRIPASLQPRKSGYKTKLKLKGYKEKDLENISTKGDAYITLLGPMANAIYPITAKQERPMPGFTMEVPEIWKKMNAGIDGYGVNKNP